MDVGIATLSLIRNLSLFVSHVGAFSLWIAPLTILTYLGCKFLFLYFFLFWMLKLMAKFSSL